MRGPEGARPPLARQQEPTNRTLGPVGQVAVLCLLVLGTIVAVASGLGIVGFLPFAGMGAILVIRRPRTSIGWILLGLGWAFAIVLAPVPGTLEQYANGTIDVPAKVLAVLQGGSGTAAFFLFAVLATVFPSGRLPTGGWGIVSRAGLGAGLVLIGSACFMPIINVNIAGSPSGVLVRNPVAVLPDLAIWQVIRADTAIFPIMVLFLVAAVSLVVRARHARGTERQQLRWIAASIAFVVAAVGTGFAIAAIIPGSSDSGLAWIPALVAFPCVPIAVGIAVLRYRLYEIDRIISRTIAYAVITGALIAVFASVVLALQAALAGITQGETIPVAASTLVVAALAQPLRRRVQGIVDRRFNRAGVDAERTVAAFADRLRDEIEIGSLREELAAAVSSALQPTSLGVWIRSGGTGG